MTGPGDNTEQPAQSVLDDLRWRGLLAESTDEHALRAALAEGPVTYYVGFDPTAPSLHHGNLVQLVTARRLQQAGHRPLLLIGGSTGLIGDPKPDAERTLNDPETVAGWVERLKRQVTPFVDFDGPNAARIVNNLDWTAPVSVLEFLRDIGRHFRVNKMIQKEVVKARLDTEQGIGYAEFSYQILQAFDYLELYRRYGCTLQTGGSDQWGNITAGVDLIRRVEGAAVHAMATPLLTRSDGTKFGKSAGGLTVWLDPEMMSPYAFYQFWFNTADADVGQYLRVFSFRSREELEALEKTTAERPAAREAQRVLAEELTTLVHGADECARVIAASGALFGRGALTDVDARTLDAALREAPHVRVERDPGGALPPLVDLLADTGLVASRSAARRTIDEGGAYLNNERVTSVESAPSAGDLLHGRWLVLRRGRRNVAGVEVAS
ncbi:tyrosine--tRNA ligase [Actinopolymorpha singaporensis]|uniref:Tyrosine--tRNA ligase n=1 Tax=Actinopolymorpha singaporensis TaxID=117157 RepID=A0A1H1W347_9ACTN|nr:tyrosine--tRNA ligase [Actinopolymorpha singaporensis]SDS91557.1 tyrosyl-tRNA synthetase [Actinopolymorpha singaporensis]